MVRHLSPTFIIPHSSFIPFMIPLASACIILEWLSWKKYGNPYQLLLHPIACGIMVAIMILLNNPVSNQFIYFAF
jgi:hypothetical protein